MDSLPIDFTDPEDIRAKLPRAKRQLEVMEAAFRKQAGEMEDWRDYVRTLVRRAERLGVVDAPAASDETQGTGPADPDPEATPKTEERPPAAGQPVDLVVEVVNREIRKIKAKAVADTLRSEGHDLPNVTVSNSLFYAAKRVSPARIKVAEGRGFYAPLGYVEDVAPDGLPAPDQLHVAAAAGEQRGSPEGGGT